MIIVLCDVRPGHVRCVLFVPYINGNQFAAPLFTMTQQPQWAGRASSLSRIRDHTELDTPQSVGLLWTSDQPDAQTSTSQHTTLTTDRHPWPRRDSNPQSQQASALDRIRDTKPTKCICKFALQFHIEHCYMFRSSREHHQGIKPNQYGTTPYYPLQLIWCKTSNSENVDSLLDPVTFTQKQSGDTGSCLHVLLNQTAAFLLCNSTFMFWYSHLQLACWALLVNLLGTAGKLVGHCW